MEPTCLRTSAIKTGRTPEPQWYNNVLERVTPLAQTSAYQGRVFPNMASQKIPIDKVSRAGNQGNGRHCMEVESVAEWVHVTPYEMSPEGCGITAKELGDLQKQREARIQRNIEAKIRTLHCIFSLSLPQAVRLVQTQVNPGYLYQRRELRRRKV